MNLMRVLLPAPAAAGQAGSSCGPSMRLLAGVLAALLCAGLPDTALAGPTAGAVQGVVTQVIDGETLAFTAPGKPPVTVKLRDIDAPEICQPGGQEARRALTDLALNKPAVLRGRTVLVADVDLSVRMVEDGQAWSVRTRYDQGPLVKQERMARTLGRGLHAVPGAVMPSDFRKQHGPCPG